MQQLEECRIFPVILFVAVVLALGCEPRRHRIADQKWFTPLRLAVAPAGTQEGQLSLRVVLINPSGKPVALSDEAVSTWLGVTSLLSTYVRHNDEMIQIPTPISRYWPWSRATLGNSGVAPGSATTIDAHGQMELGLISVTLASGRGTYDIWCTLFLPHGDPKALGTEWGGDPGILLQSNVVKHVVR